MTSKSKTFDRWCFCSLHYRTEHYRTKIYIMNIYFGNSDDIIKIRLSFGAISENPPLSLEFGAQSHHWLLCRVEFHMSRVISSEMQNAGNKLVTGYSVCISSQDMICSHAAPLS